MSNKPEKTREIDYSVVDAGPLYVDPKYKEPGFQYIFVNANTPGEIEKYQRYGYDVVVDEETSVGRDTPAKSSPHGAAVTVQSKCGALLLLMRITNELHTKLMAYRDAKNKEITNSIHSLDKIPEKFQTGSITTSQPK